jgi:hypothetical protein
MRAEIDSTDVRGHRSRGREQGGWPMIELSRRRFGTMVLGGAAVVAVGGVSALRIGASEARIGIRTFDVHHDPSVYVTMTSGSPFVVEVKRRDTSEVLEHFDGVTAFNLLELTSRHVSFVEFL